MESTKRMKTSSTSSSSEERIIHSFDKYQGKGLSGLANMGNTCFINTCIQILSHTYELSDFLNNEEYKQKLKNKFDSVLFLEWDNLRQVLWKENCIVRPGKFIKTIQKMAEIKKMDMFTGFSQNDFPEFLLFLIDSFHSSLSREVVMSISGQPENDIDQMAIKCFEMIQKTYSKDYSEIWNMFYGIHISKITSLETEEILAFNPEPYFIIDLSLPQLLGKQIPTLLDCFDLYVEGEILEGENAWFNEKTQKKQAVRKNIVYWSFPTILVIDIKRYNSNHLHQKLQTLVDFPLTNLDLSKYVVGYKKQSYIYDLYAICNHMGGTSGGHYTAYVKNADGHWYHFNDTRVERIHESQLITSKAYCFFYRKKNI